VLYIGPFDQAARRAGSGGLLPDARKVDGIAVSPANAAAWAHIARRGELAAFRWLTWEFSLRDRDKVLRLAYIARTITTSETRTCRRGEEISRSRTFVSIPAERPRRTT